MREFFRMVRGEGPTLRDFLSHRALGLPLPNPALEREWAEGVSVYDNFDQACQIAARFQFRFGAYLVWVIFDEKAPSGAVKYPATSLTT